MKNSSSTFKNRTISIDVAEGEDNKKSTNINVLLNRVKNEKKNESMKKLYFSAAASTGLVLFGLLIF